jgi:hypothetical protein
MVLLLVGSSWFIGFLQGKKRRGGLDYGCGRLEREGALGSEFSEGTPFKSTGGFGG